MEHLTIEANNGSFHIARSGKGPTLLLLHGWPEFWLDWKLVMERLADRHTLVAPDQRGFGYSEKPTGPFGPKGLAADMLALLEALGIKRAGVVGGAALARKAPNRLLGLFFGFVYPDIGPRMGTPDRLSGIWYQSFNQMEMAPALVGASRDTCRTYIGHFLRHWAHRKHAHDGVLEAYVDNFLRPGNLECGFAHYKTSHVGYIAMMKGEAAALPLISKLTCVRWAEHDPLFPYAWTDRLGETFSDLDLAPFPGIGHFPHREDPDRAAAREIDHFFSRLTRN